VRPPPDPVSPELVLVAPPDEARRAREQLPEPVGAKGDGLLPSARALAAQRPSAPERQRSPRRRRWVRRTVVGGVLLLVAASAVAAGLAGWRDTHDKGTAKSTVGPLRQERSTPTSSTATTTVERRHATSAPGRGRRATQPNSHASVPATPNKRPAKKGPPKKPTRHRRPAVTRFAPARTWSWQPRSGARRYVFTLQRNGKRVIEARMTKPRYVLPKRFRFAAGRYRWRVVAVTKTPSARRKLVVDSRFRLSAAGAAAANR
jgi:hypothetical protein